MSDEYINKEDAIQSIIAHDLVGGDSRGWAEYLLENTSAVDAVPVRHGRWVVIDAEEPRRYGCSECKRLSWNMENYCGNCGARMDGENDEIDRR